MTNSESTELAGETLRELFETLDEEHLRRKIDEPLHIAAGSFRNGSGGSFSHLRFIEEIGSFAQHIYRHGLLLSEELSPEQARAEVVALLERYYRSNTGHGFAAALLDTANAENGRLESVIEYLVQAIKCSQREKYTQHIFNACLNRCDWQTRCRLAELLLNHFRPFLPENILRCPPAQLVGNIPELLLGCLHVQTLVEQIETSSGLLHGH